MTATDALSYPFDSHPATGEVRAIAPGVSWIRLPLPFALDHINVWLLDDGEQLVLVDTGFALDPVKETLTTLLAAQARKLGRIVVTHYHPDHIGLAGWLSETHDAPVVMTQGEYLAAHAVWNQLPGYASADMLRQFAAHGIEETRLTALRERGNLYRRGAPRLPTQFSRIFDGDHVAMGGHDWQVITGHGHSPEHASFYSASAGALISGDMLLPRISTNISVLAATPDDDPLSWFLDSLQRFTALPDETLVLPSHGQPFRGIRARVQQLANHHAERCNVLLAALTQPRQAAELLDILFERELDTHQVMFAMGEAIAHLNHLVHHGRARRHTDADGRIHYTRAA